MAPELFHSIPESSSAIVTSGRPTVTSNPVLTALPAVMHEPVSPGIVAFKSTRLMPVTPHSSSCWELFCVMLAYSAGLDSFDGGIAGVAAYFHVLPSTLVGTSPGASFQLEGSDSVPLPRNGNTASAWGAATAQTAATSASTALTCAICRAL